jgi:hypothetical protein
VCDLFSCPNPFSGKLILFLSPVQIANGISERITVLNSAGPNQSSAHILKKIPTFGKDRDNFDCQTFSPELPKAHKQSISVKLTAIFMAFYLLLGGFFPKGDYTQFLRLAELGRHYRLHAQEARNAHKEVSFLLFLQMHYFNTQIHQGDHEQDHEDLPFHHITPSVDQMVPLTWTMARLTLPSAGRHLPASVCPLYHSEYPARIFHPPIAG